MKTVSSGLSLVTVKVVSSRLSHSVPQRVQFLFFQCQFAVDGGKDMVFEFVE